MVAVMMATVVSLPSSTAITSPCVTVSVRPGFTTRPTARKRSPFAGDIRFTLNSTVSTADPAGISEKAA